MCYHNDKSHLHKTPQVTFISIATISIAPTPLKKKNAVITTWYRPESIGNYFLLPILPLTLNLLGLNHVQLG